MYLRRGSFLKMELVPAAGDTITFFVNIEYQGMPVKLVYKGKLTGSEIKFSFGTEDGSWGTEISVKKS